MSLNEWLAVGVAIASLVVSFAGMVRWLVKHYLHELVPNSGSSMKDRVVRLEHDVSEIRSDVKEIYKLLIERNVNG
jgi:hypothetical protein